MPTDPKQTTKSAEELEAKVADLTKRLERSDAVLSLTSEQRAYFDKLDESTQELFLKFDEDGRAGEMRKSAEQDSIVYTSLDGHEFRKSDDARLVDMAKRADEERRENARLRAASANAVLEKRATEELDALPGELATRVALLKAIDSIEDEALRKAAHESVAAGNNALKKAFTSFGHRHVTGAEGDAEAELDRMAKAHAKEHNVDYLDAYEKVAAANPALLEKAIGTTTPARS